MMVDRTTAATTALVLAIASALVPEQLAGREAQPLVLVVGLVLVGCGLATPADGRSGRSGALLVAAGFAWIVPGFDVTGRDSVDRAIASLSLVHVPLLVAAIVVVPVAAVPRAARAVAIVPAGAAALSAATGGYRTILALTGLSLCSIALIGWARLPRRRTSAALSFVAAGLVYGGTLAVTGLVRLVAASPPERTLTTTYELAVAVTAMLVLGAVVLAREIDAVELQHGGAEAIAPTVARLVGDPRLSIAFPDEREWLDPLGRPRAAPSDTAVVIDHGGTTLARIETSAPIDEGLRRRLGELLLLGRDNARLRRTVTRQLDELGASRRRLLVAGDEERAKLEAELRRGALDRLDAIDALLSAVPEAERARERVTVTRVELEQVARGLDPLARGMSIMDALLVVVGDDTTSVTLDVDERGIEGDVQRGLWYACAEGLANAWKHAPGASVQITIGMDGRRAVATVSDDGPGGADPTGSGLHGLADRINALGGALEVASLPGGGTRLRVELPVESTARPVDVPADVAA